VDVYRSQTGTRDFVIRRQVDAQVEDINPMQLLGLPEATRIIERFRSQHPAQALVLALVRLLVACLEYRGNRRHLVVEEWGTEDLRGEALSAGTRTDHARDRADEQAEQYRVVTTGELPPAGSLAEIFWAAHTELPWLPGTFEDANLGAFARALYFELVPEGEGVFDVDGPALQSRIGRLWRTHFADLDIPIASRERRPLFRRLMAATIRLASQVNLWVAKLVIFDFLRHGSGHYGPDEFAADEQSLLELRYGACRALGDINIGLLCGCGPLFAELVNVYAISLLGGASVEVRANVEQHLRDHFFLLGELRRRRRLARAAQRRELRDRYADPLPKGRRVAPEHEADQTAESPPEQAIFNEEWGMLESLLPRLKKRDQRRLRALLEWQGNRRAAAESLGLDLEIFSRQLRQTTLPNLREAVAELRASGEITKNWISDGC
jgi:hypothetical protein